MGSPIRFPRLSLAALALLMATSCSSPPTYPKEHLVESLQALLASEHLETVVRFIGQTLAVQVSYPHALAQNGTQVSFGPAFDEATQKAMPAIHRVLFSTDADIRFYVLLISDPTTPGIYLTMVRYLDDLRRLDVHKIDTPEFFARTVLELNAAGSGPLTLDQYIQRSVQLEEFLSWQLSRRIQGKLTQEFEALGVATVGRCAGKFQNGEFAFLLDVSPIGHGALDEEMMRRVFQSATNVIAHVLSSYHFASFTSVRLIHPLTGRNILLPRANLDVFR